MPIKPTTHLTPFLLPSSCSTSFHRLRCLHLRLRSQLQPMHPPCRPSRHRPDPRPLRPLVVLIRIDLPPPTSYVYAHHQPLSPYPLLPLPPPSQRPRLCNPIPFSPPLRWRRRPLNPRDDDDRDLLVNPSLRSTTPCRNCTFLTTHLRRHRLLTIACHRARWRCLRRRRRPWATGGVESVEAVHQKELEQEEQGADRQLIRQLLQEGV